MQALMKYLRNKYWSTYSFERKKELILVSTTGISWIESNRIRKARNIGLLFPAVSF